MLFRSYEVGLGRAYGGSGPVFVEEEDDGCEGNWVENIEGGLPEFKIRDSLAACASTHGNEGRSAGVGKGHVEAARVDLCRTECFNGVRFILRALCAIFEVFIADDGEG